MVNRVTELPLSLSALPFLTSTISDEDPTLLLIGEAVRRELPAAAQEAGRTRFVDQGTEGSIFRA